MKKTLMTCLAIAVAFAIAGSALAITCTVDQRPGATLLVPYFQVSFDGGGNLNTSGPDARDTIVTIANASSAPMIAHVNVYDRQSNLVLDFNVALTGFDVQPMRVSDLITGFLPNTTNAAGEDACQVNPDANVYPSGDGFLRVRPLAPATGQDNSQATTAYGTGQYQLGLVDALTANCDGGHDLLAIGYMVIDHVNYCNLSDPTDGNYYYNDAIGMENNLWGEIVFTSAEGLPTYAMSTVNLEADNTIGQAAADSIDGNASRSFYARYFDPDSDYTPAPFTSCPNCSQGALCSTDTGDNFLDCHAIWDVGIDGDQREPLGLRWAARWFDEGTALTSNFRVWRASTSGNGNCDVNEPIVTLRFYDEDENTTNQGKCPSPCTNPTFNFPLETQQRNITDFARPIGADAGWVQMDFLDLAGGGTVLDQAWVDYSFEGTLAFESILVPGTQLDPSSCNPVGMVDSNGNPLTQIITPVIPAVVGTGVN